MNYEAFFDFDSITLEDCMRFMENNKCLLINDGHIVGIEVENEM